MLRRLKKQVLSQLPPKIRQRMIVSTDPAIARTISVALKRNFNNINDRKILEQIIMKRTQIFADTGHLSSNGLMSEIPRDHKTYTEEG